MGITGALAAPDLVPSGLQVFGERTPCEGPYPASAHPYGNFLDVSWTNTCPGAEFLEVTFDSRSSLEDQFDYLFVIAGGGTNVLGSPFTGAELAGKTLVIAGNTLVLRLETDGAISDWGFAVTSLSALGAQPLPATVVAGQDLAISWEVENQGAHPVTGPSWDTLYVSPDAFWTNGHWVGYASRFETLEPGARYRQYVTISLPYLGDEQYLIVRADNGNDIAEADETNNELLVPLATETIDLAVVALSAPTSAAPQEPITVIWTVTNLSAHTAPGDSYDQLSVSDGTRTNFLDWIRRETAVAGGASYTVTQEVRLSPVSPGTNWLRVEANVSGLAESFRDNNLASVPILITPPDLVALHAEAPPVAMPRNSFFARLVISNAGPVTAYRDWYDLAYVSPTNRLTPEAILVGQALQYSSIDSGMVYTQEFFITIGAPCSGDCYLLFVADGWTNLFDPAMNNNIVAVPLRIDTADLVPISFNASRLTAAPNEMITFDWRVENRGIIAAPWPWNDVIELATEPTGSNSFIVAASEWAQQNLPVGSNYFRSVTGRVPPAPPGDYYLVLKADRYGHLPEGNETNNWLSLPITITGANLVAESISAPAVLGVREPFTVTWTVRNLGPTSAYPPWEDIILVTSPTNLFHNWYYLGGFPASNALAPGAAYTRTAMVNGISLPAGDYSVALHTDYQFYPFGFSETNANNRTGTPIQLVGIDLVAVSLTAPPSGSFHSNVSVSLLISNAGPVTAHPWWYQYFYLSPTNYWVPEAWPVGWVQSSTQLLVNATVLITAELRLNNGNLTGNQYLVARIEPGPLSDPNPANNEIALPFHVQAPDLVPDAFAALLPYTNCPPPFAESPHPVRRSDQTWTNICPGADALKITFHPETDMGGGLLHMMDGSGNPVEGSPFQGWGLAEVTLTIPGDTVRLRFVREETWDVWGFAIVQIVGYRSVTNVPAAPQQPIDFQWRIRNAGDARTLTSWSDSLVLKVARYSSIEQEIARLYRSNPLGPGAHYSEIETVRLFSVKPGRHELQLRADAEFEVDEASETNNSRSLTLEITSPDLVAVDLQAPGTLDGQSTFEVTWRVGNRGPVVAYPDWQDQLYVSPTNRLTSEAHELGYGDTHYFPLIPGDHYSATQTVTLPALPAGNYYLIVKVDRWNALFDPAPENNEVAIPITIRLPDLTPVHLSGLVRGIPCPGPYPALSAPFPPDSEFWWTNSCPGATALNVRLGFPNHYPTGDQVSVFDADGHQVPVSGFDSGFFYNVPGDTVIIRLRTDDLANEFGFAVTSITPFMQQPLPVLEPQAEAELLYMVENLGPGASTASWYDNVYFSADAILDEHDQDVAQFGGGLSAYLPAGGRYTRALEIQVPGYSAGDYFLILKADGYNYLSEANESNNVMVLPVHLETADLHVTALSATNRAAARERIQLSWSVRNDGSATAWPSWRDYLYLSPTPVLNPPTAIFCGSFNRSQLLRPGETYTRNGEVFLPNVPAGDYYLILRADAEDSLGDSNLANNYRSTPITLFAPDLVPLSLTALRTVATCPGPYPQTPPPPFPANTTLRWTHTCPGASNLHVTFDLDSYVHQSLAILDRHRNHIPGSPVSGWIFGRRFFVPGDTVILEMATGPSPSFSGFAVADISSVMEVTNLVAEPQSRLDLKWTVQNIGAGAAMPSFTDGISLSTDPVSDPSDPSLHTVFIHQPVAPGARYTQQTSGTLGAVPAGDYYLSLKTDRFEELIELNETNNTFFIPITITPPADLAPIALRAPSAITSSHPRPKIDITWSVTNQGAATVPGSWYDTIYISTNPSPDSQATELAMFGQGGPLAPGQFYTATQTVTLQTPASGRYYLFLRVDDWSSVFEASETNNQLIATIDVELILPDLVVDSVTAPPLVVSSRYFVELPLQWVVRNQGAGAVEPLWGDSVYVNGQYHTTIHRNEPLPPGGSYTNGASLYLERPTNGLYALTVWSDSPDDYNRILETEETNNARTVSFEIVRSPEELVLPGEIASVPLWFASPAPVSLLTFDLLVPGDKLHGLQAWGTVSELWYAHFYFAEQNLYNARIEAFPGAYLSGTQEIARITFETFPDQTSAFVPLWISNAVPNVSVRAGRAVIIGAEPLLEATSLPGGQYSLTLYGHPGSNVVLEAQAPLSGATWDSVWAGRMTNRFQPLGPFPAADRSRFYRARY